MIMDGYPTSPPATGQTHSFDSPEKRKKDGIFSKIKKGGSAVGGWFADKGKKIAQSFSGDTTGMCLSGSAGLGFGGTESGCFVSTRRPDGKADFGLSFSKGSETPSVGLNGGVSFMSSNATDFDQLRGDGWGGTLTAAYGVGATVSHERAIGATNSRGEPVGATSVGRVGGLGVEAGATTSHVRVLVELAIYPSGYLVWDESGRRD